MAHAIGTRLQLGYAGSITRSSDVVIQNRISAGAIPFGAPVHLNPDNTVALFGAGATNARFAGFAVRVVKQQQAIFEALGSYRKDELTDFLVRGSIAVPFKGVGTPTAGGVVFIRTALNPSFPDAAVGDVEAGADGANTVQLSNAHFTTGVTDSSGVIEVTVNERRI